KAYRENPREELSRGCDLRRSAKPLFRNSCAPAGAGTPRLRVPWAGRVQLPDADVLVKSTLKAVSMPGPSSRVSLTNRSATIRGRLRPWHTVRAHPIERLCRWRFR